MKQLHKLVRGVFIAILSLVSVFGGFTGVVPVEEAQAQASRCSGSGTTWNCAAGATVSQVQTAINTASDGATITFASGNYNWSGNISLNNIDGVTMICASAGMCNVSFSGDLISRDYVPNTLSQLMRISGFNFTGNPGTAVIWMYGSNNIEQMRIDHNKFTIGPSMIAILFGEISSSGKVFGVIDHNNCTATNNFMCLKNISGGSLSSSWLTN